MLDKLRAAAAYNDAERRRLRELTATYERALAAYAADGDAAAMQAAVEQAKARRMWATVKGVQHAKFALLRLRAKHEAAGNKVERSIRFATPYRPPQATRGDDDDFPDAPQLRSARTTHF